MSRTFKDSPKSRAERKAERRGRRRNISVRAARRQTADLNKYARAVIEYALAAAEAEAADAEPSDGPTPEEHEV